MENKYELRVKETPYYYENNIENAPVKLKEFEVFDGNVVRWAIKEDKSNGFAKTTPLFENMVDGYGYDRKRILYLDKENLVFYGKMGNNEVIGRINSDNQNFVTIANFGENKVRIQEVENNKALVSFIKDDVDKCLYFDYKEFSPCTNIFDNVYVDSTFLKSYIINGSVRPFVGLANFDNGSVKQLGFDVCKQEFIHFPLDENGFIDDAKMINDLNEEFYNIGYKRFFYKSIDKRNLIALLVYLDIDGFGVVNRLKEQYKVKRKIK